MSQKYQIHRSIILDVIGIAPAYDDQHLPSSQRIEEAIKILDQIKVSGIPLMYRLGHVVEGEWAAYNHPPVFEQLTDRIVAGVPGGDPSLLIRMVECLEPPYYLLYVLHTPTGEGLPGRYQSPAISLSDVKDFLSDFAPYFAGDGRFDLWALAPSDKATVVWDRHNRMFCYGPLERYAEKLVSMGFGEGDPTIPAPHAHHYRFPIAAQEVLAAFDWLHSPLRPEDAQ
jgi:hypothetical protein